MKISLNEIKKYVNIPADISTDELVRRIGSRLVEVEGTEDWGAKYQGIYIVKVVECEPIPDTHLHRCTIDVGGRNTSSEGPKTWPSGPERPEEDGISSSTLQVVCGAPNVHQDMLAVWIAPGSIVPATYGTADELRLDVRKLRGYESHGMLAGADELALGDDHSGIVEIDPDFAQPGDVFADKFDLNDIILDIENKSLTHRPDCFGLIGFAREVAGILGLKFEYVNCFAKNIPQPPSRIDNAHDSESEVASSARNLPDVVNSTTASEDRSEQSNLHIQITDPTICPRYSCAVMEFTNAPRSPYLTPQDIFLYKADMRPVSPIVDITNVIMLQTGQPLHAFDYDKFIAVGGTKEPKIIVRTATDGEQLELLDDKNITCDTNDILITSNNIPVALAGAMGGKNTEIDNNTKRIILESATFSLYNLRKTQMKHGIFSEAITRFTKGQPASITMPVLQQAVTELGLDHLVSYSDAYPAPQEEIVVKITTSEVNSLLGTAYDTDTIEQTLANVGFEDRSEDSKSQIHHVKVPTWRTDIHIKEDLIEEIGRLLGYDNIPLDYPLRPFTAATPDSLFALKSNLRNILSDKLNAHEVLTYSFVSENLQQRVGENPDNSYKIINSISPELQCFRQSLTPSLLSKVRANLKDGYKNFTLYEMNQISRKSDGLDEDKVPITHAHLSVLTLGNYYDLKALANALWSNLKITLQSNQFASDTDYPYFEPKHSVTLYLADQNANQAAKIGAFGEIRTSVLRQFKLESTPVSALELNLETLLPLLDAPERPQIAQNKFPAVSRDLTFTVASEANFGQLRDLLQNIFTEKQLIFSLTPVSIYQKLPSSSTKNLSFHVKFASPDHTLANDEISAIIDTVTKKAAAAGAKLI